jgi:hypothetical protein
MLFKSFPKSVGPFVHNFLLSKGLSLVMPTFFRVHGFFCGLPPFLGPLALVFYCGKE